MASPNESRRLAAVGLSEELLAECRSALHGVAQIDPLPGASERALSSREIDALVVALSPPLVDSMAVFSELRRQHPLIPFLVVAQDVDANFAAEILKCGADDLVMLPPAPGVLRHKVRRMLGEASGAAMNSAEFAAFRAREFDVNSRRCFRVIVPPDFPISSTFPGPIDRALDVKDLSIETEQAPGGLQIATDREMARRLPFDQWQRRSEIEVVVQLPSGSPVKARARLIPGLRTATDGSIRFAVEYWLARPAEKERFRRYWVEAQRRMQRARK
jgi:hypothetical protein